MWARLCLVNFPFLLHGRATWVASSLRKRFRLTEAIMVIMLYPNWSDCCWFIIDWIQFLFLIGAAAYLPHPILCRFRWVTIRLVVFGWSWTFRRLPCKRTAYWFCLVLPKKGIAPAGITHVGYYQIIFAFSFLLKTAGWSSSWCSQSMVPGCRTN